MAKKTFTDAAAAAINPALQFISDPGPDQLHFEGTPASSEASELNKQRTVNKTLPESKTCRLQLVVQPSLKAELKAAAEKQGCSVNQFIIDCIELRLKQK